MIDLGFTVRLPSSIERACSSPTLLAVAKANKKAVLIDQSNNDALDIGSYGAFDRDHRTQVKFHFGTIDLLTGLFLAK